MADILIKDGNGVSRYLHAHQAGTAEDPHIPIHGTDVFVANETNIRSEYLLNGGSEDQNVDGSVTPVTFSTEVVPVGKVFIVARVIIYMEGTGHFDSNKFGNLTALTNGWTLAMNGVEAMVARHNRELVSYMFDAHGSKIFGKEAETLIGRFTFAKFTPGGVGISIRAGETLSTIVKDDLESLVYLSVRAQGVYIDEEE